MLPDRSRININLKTTLAEKRAKTHMVHSKVAKIELSDYGSHLGMEKGCFKLTDKHGEVTLFPLFEKEIGEVILKSGNTVSTGALASLGFWNIDVLIMTQRGRPVGTLRSIEDNSHVETRINQYEAYKNTGKAIGIMKQIVKAKIEGQTRILRKYGLKFHPYPQLPEYDTIEMARRKLMYIEGKYSTNYFNQIFKLLPIHPEHRRGFKAFHGVDNIFNLCYELLAWKVYIALIRAKLEPYLGFLHTLKYGTPSLVCDFQELYRYLIDDFIIQFCQNLRKRDFTLKWDSVSSRQAKREYLKDKLTAS